MQVEVKERVPTQCDLARYAWDVFRCSQFAQGDEGMDEKIDGRAMEVLELEIETWSKLLDAINLLNLHNTSLS